MANLVLISLFSIIAFIYAENVSNLSTDDYKELPSEKASNSTDVIAFLEDTCVNKDNEEVRKVRDKFIKASSNLKTVGSRAIGAVGFAGPDFGGPIYIVREAALSIIFLIDVIKAEADRRESPELEYTKCFKKEYDEFKNQMIEDMKKILKDIINLRGELQRQFQEIQQNLKELKDQIDVLQNEMRKQFIEIKKLIFAPEVGYDRFEQNIRGIPILNEEFFLYMESPTDSRKERFLMMCGHVDNNPRFALETISETNLKYIFDLPSSNNYAVLLTTCKNILAAVINILFVEINCWAMMMDKLDEAHSRKHWEFIEAKAKNISDRMVAKLQEVKNYNNEHVIPVVLKELIPNEHCTNDIANAISRFMVSLLKFQFLVV